ncbi:hypothetical protein O0L34_g4684 [Tuta absoluta]|nr:hypothetical protein O0L34_g4684 [Tuta absoluta]
MKECLTEAVTQKYSLLLVQEPYVGSKAHVTIGNHFRVIQRATSDTDKPVRAAIVVIDPNIHFNDNPDLVSEDIVGTTIKIGERQLGLINVYLHGDGDINIDLRKIRDTIQKLKTPDIIIAGDVNAKSFWWGSDIEDTRGTDLAETLAELDLNVLNEGNIPTFRMLRQGIWCTSIVDVTACSTSILGKIPTWRVNEQLCTLSDHNGIEFIVDFGMGKNNPNKISTRRFNTTKADWPKFSQILKEEIKKRQITEENIIGMTSKEDIENLAIEYTQAVNTACEMSIPAISNGAQAQKKSHWWTPELTQRKKEVIRIRKRIRKANPRRKKYVIEQYNKAKDDYKTSIEKAITQSWMDFCSRQERENVWQCSYRILKHCSRKSHDKLLRSSDNGDMLSPEESAKLLADTFYPEDTEDTDSQEQRQIREEYLKIIHSLEQLNTLPAEFEPFTSQEISQIFCNMNPKKAPGSDGFTSDICQRAYNADKTVFIAICNKCFGVGYFPGIWKRAVIKVIPKPGKDDYAKPKSYRPIGLLPVMGKVLEKLFVNRLQWQLGRENKLNGLQYGFTPQRSTEDALYDAMTTVYCGLASKKIVVLVSLDIEGAFDNAWWPVIIRELQNKQVDRFILKLIASYLSDREIHLNYAGASVDKPTNKGCVQGSTCGPILWNVQLDPLLQRSSQMPAHIQAFADDILIIGIGSTGEEVESKINKTLEIVAEWGKTHKMTFAPHKTQAILVTKKVKYVAPKLKMQGTTIEFTDNLKILGLNIDRNLNFKLHLEGVCGKALNLYKMVSKAARAQWGLNSEIVRTIYLAVVEPTILYSASIWAKPPRKNSCKKCLTD